MVKKMRINNIRFFISVSVILVFCFSGQAQPSDHVIYKQIDTTSLAMDVFYPEKLDSGKVYPAIVFFFGGGWITRGIKQFEPHAKYFASRGMVCFLADYRIQSVQHTTPFESLKDAKSAVRFIREHAAEFHVDPKKLVASGGSAGGHLAAATALIKGFNDKSDDLSISCVPNALILFNPVIDNGPAGYGYERIGEKVQGFFTFTQHKKRCSANHFLSGNS